MSPSRTTFYRSKGVPRSRRGGRRGVLFAVGLVAAVAWVLVASETGWWAMRAKANENAQKRAELEQVQLRTTELDRATRELLEPGSDQLEKVAREHYLMSRPGERVLHVLEETTDPAESGESR